MKNLVLLLVLLICIAAYVHAQRPATWNSWMATVDAPELVIPATLADSGTPGASAAATGPDASAAPSVSPLPTARPTPPAPARAIPVGGLLHNGYFVAGEDSWEGDGTPDPSGRGLVVTLSPSSWTRVYQTFADQGTQNSIEVTYKFSPGLTFSQDPAAYTDIGKRVQVAAFGNFGSFPVSPGHFIGMIGGPRAFSLCEYSPPLGLTDVQDYQHEYPATPASSTTTLALAFPPGSGTITLLSAYLMSR